MKSYACCKCLRENKLYRHFEDEQIYKKHISQQSKQGITNEILKPSPSK